jgi:hypothetical protein
VLPDSRKIEISTYDQDVATFLNIPCKKLVYVTNDEIV